MINATGNRMMREINRQQNLARSISDSQISISTAKRIQRASDDPVAAARVATLRQSQADDAVWNGNLSLGGSLAAQADSVLKTISDRMLRANELVIAGANGNLSPADRNTIKQELISIADEIDSYAMTESSLGQPLFATNATVMRFDTGTVFAPVPSRTDVFETGGVAISQIVRDAANAVSTGTTGTALSSIQSATAHIADTASNIGVRGARIDRMREALSGRGIEYAEERSGLEDTDLTQAIATLNAQTLTLDAAQAAFARINRRTLMDILG
jgi:flagellar hook-associated protein 3 FlgL